MLRHKRPACFPQARRAFVCPAPANAFPRSLTRCVLAVGFRAPSAGSGSRLDTAPFCPVLYGQEGFTHEKMNPFILKLVDLALKEVGIREVGNNHGPQIREYQKATWLEPGEWPWSASFCCWLLREWTKAADVQKALKLETGSEVARFLCHDPRACGWEKWAKERRIKIVPGEELAKAGDFVIFDFPHIGLVMADQNPTSRVISTIEGNTTSQEGNGVWKNIRARSLVKSYIRCLNK